VDVQKQQLSQGRSLVVLDVAYLEPLEEFLNRLVGRYKDSQVGVAVAEFFVEACFVQSLAKEVERF